MKMKLRWFQVTDRWGGSPQCNGGISFLLPVRTHGRCKAVCGTMTLISDRCFYRLASFRSMALFQNNNITLVYVRACVSIWRCCRCLKCVFSVYIMVLAALVLWIFAVQVLSKTEVLWIKQKVFLSTTLFICRYCFIFPTHLMLCTFPKMVPNTVSCLTLIGNRLTQD